MGVLQAGLLNQPSAQVIDGGLRFDKSRSQYLKRTPDSAGNRSYYTGSAWVKRTAFSPQGNGNSNAQNYTIFSAGTNTANNIDNIKFYKNAGGDDNRIAYESYPGSFQYNVMTNARYRDPTGWYHVIWNYNGTRSEIYINGEHVTSLDTNTQNGGSGGHFNNNVSHVIGHSPDQQYNMEFDGFMSQFYWIDGLALGPGYFGFTDPLTNTWRPKKFIAEGTTVNDGTTWSSGIPGNTLSGYPATNAFNGNVSSFVYAGVNATMTWTAPKRITGQKIEVYAYAGGNWPILEVNGKSTGAVVSGTTQHNVWVDVTDLCGGPGGVLETITAYGQNIGGVDRQSGFSAVAVDGVILIDSTTQNLDFGTNGFYLPVDGNSPIGQDKSGKGNDFTPINFNGSNSLDKATGALPILNTTPGGVSASVGVRTDANASSLVLALPLVGSANDVSNQINSGSTAKSLADYGDPAASSIKSNFYGGSFYYDGNDGHDLGVINDTDLEMGSSDFCIEGWFNANTTLDSNYWNPILTLPWHGQNNGESQIFIGFAGGASGPYSAGEFHARIRDSSSIKELPTGLTTLYNDQTWHHFALTKNGTTAALFVDGVLKKTVTTEASLNTDLDDQKGYIATYNNNTGSPGSPQGFYKGYISDLRIYKGVAKYTENFIPASTDPDILLDSPSGVSGGSKLTKITDGAVSFEGINETALSVNNNTDIQLGSGTNWTIEFFAYRTGAFVDYDVIAGKGASSTYEWFIEGFADGSVDILYSANGSTTWTGQHEIMSNMALNRWYHIALVRNGSGANNFKAYVDGIQTLQTTAFDIYAGTGVLHIGGYNGAAGQDPPIIISNFRIVNGSSVYTSNFTPPTEPLTNITNTKLLCCQSTTEPASAAVAPLISGINDGTQWSNYVTGDIDSSNPAHKAFDGSTSDIGCRTQTAGGATIVWQPPSPIAFSSSFKIYAARDGSSSQIIFTVRHAGGTTNFSESVTTSATPAAVDLAQISGVTSPISSITIVSAGANPRFTAIEVDNTILVDPIAPNGDVSATNFNPFNTDIKTVLGQETGYATWNPLKMGTSDTSMSEGNLFWRTTSNGPDKCTYSTLGMNSGKWYWENEVVEATATAIGIANVYSNQDLGPANAHNWMYYSATGQVYLDGSASSYGAAFNTNGTIIGVAFDRDNLTLEFYKNGASQGKLTKISGLIDTETYYAMCGDSGGASQSQVRVNFGQKPFKFPPPEGFQSLNTANLRPEKIITRPDKYFGAFTYTGTGNTSGREISGLNFKAKPDLIWIKNRGEDIDHILFDSVRGFGANKELIPNNNYTQGQTGSGAPNTQSWGFVKSNNIDGFTVQSGSSGQSVVNNNNIGYVSWCWKAGGDNGQFNIDDVGYANASDVGMNVGGQNSNEYDQSVTWSNGVASSAGDWPGGFNTACGAITNGFNGNTSNGVCASPSASIIWTNPQSTSTLSGKLEFYNRSDTTTYSRRIIITHAGGTTGRITLTPNSAWQDLGTYTGITSLIITGDNPGGGVIDAIRVGGKILVDQGITPPNVPSIANIGASVGTKQGFSIIQYQGGGNSVTTVAHGLSQKPQFMMIKNMDDNDTWTCYHYGIGNTKYLNFPQTYDYEQDGTMFNDTTPTSSVFTLGAAPGNDYHNRANRSGYDYIAYCWHDVPGLQKFGFYPGASVNGGVGDFIECGFRPALILVKKYTPNGDGGVIFDTARAVFNPGRTQIRPNEPSAETIEYDSFQFDFLANGFRAVGPSGQVNEHDDAFVFAAWAEVPAFNLYGGQSNAR